LHKKETHGRAPIISSAILAYKNTLTRRDGEIHANTAGNNFTDPNSYTFPTRADI
jgi:hypothetical protein